MMKLVVVLCLLGVALADSSLADRVDGLEVHVDKMQSSVASCCEATAKTKELNGCGEVCADEITLNSIPSATFSPAIQDGTCYVVDGTFPSGTITVPHMVKCAKITVPSSSGIRGISAELPRPSCPAPLEMLRRGARRSMATTMRSLTKARLASPSRRASRVRCFLLSLCGP